MTNRSIPHWGWRLDGRTLVRSIDGSRHLLRHPRAIAFDADAYEELRDRFNDLAVFDREAGITYRTWAHNFDLHRGCSSPASSSCSRSMSSWRWRV
jgi:hypothetical protein